MRLAPRPSAAECLGGRSTARGSAIPNLALLLASLPPAKGERRSGGVGEESMRGGGRLGSQGTCTHQFIESKCGGRWKKESSQRLSGHRQRFGRLDVARTDVACTSGLIYVLPDGLVTFTTATSPVLMCAARRMCDGPPSRPRTAQSPIKGNL